MLTVRLFVGDCRRPWLGLVAIKRGPLAHWCWPALRYEILAPKGRARGSATRTVAGRWGRANEPLSCLNDQRPANPGGDSATLCE